MSIRRRIGVDCDNVVAATEARIRDMIRERYGLSLSRDDLTQFNYRTPLLGESEIAAVLLDFHTTRCCDVGTVPGVVACLRSLCEVADVDIVTSRPRYSDQATARWLIGIGLTGLNRVIFTDTKEDLAWRYFAFVDDRLETAVNMAKLGVHSLLFDYPWNRTDSTWHRLHRVRCWDQACALLRQLLGGAGHEERP
jgi:5' nucleotidase, deoxy (Pyrimidine), cytosolic type C protein (NT5C)